MAGPEISGATSFQEEACDYFTGIVPLEECNFDDINLFFIRQKIDINDCDVLIRSSAFKGNTELGVPLRVNRFLKDIDCKLTLTCEE